MKEIIANILNGIYNISIIIIGALIIAFGVYLTIEKNGFNYRFCIAGVFGGIGFILIISFIGIGIHKIVKFTKKYRTNQD